MAEILQRFGPSPFTTAVGQKIEQATDSSLQSENWALNMEICDLVNETEDGPRDAARALKKRLQQTAGKNFSAFLLTLTVLETCVKNCNKRFHVLVTTKDFVQDLFKLIGPKNDPSPAVQERVLSIIQSWAEAFHGQADMQGVSQYYNELRNKGVEFPKSKNEPRAPIHTPQARSNSHSVVDSVGSSSHSQHGSSPPTQGVSSMGANLSSPAPASASLYPIHLSPEQLNKLKNEIEVVQGNMNVLNEMLNAMDPTNENHRDDAQLLIELHATCVSMQKRIVDLIEKVSNEEVTNELLRINDELNNLFTRYERFQKKQPMGANALNANGSKAPETITGIGSKQPKIQSLIDFSDEVNPSSSIVDQLKSVKLNEGVAGDSDFDMFAQIRSNPAAPGPSVGFTAPAKPSGSTQLPPLVSTSTPKSAMNAEELKEMNDIESWLQQQPPQDTPSMQFENFLSQRQDELEQQPSRPSNADASKKADNSLL